MSFNTFLIYLAVTAGTTYLVRVVPMLLVKKEIENKFILSFLYYMPYAVLSVMTIPAIFTATNYIASAVVGFGVAVFLALKNKSLTTVAIAACLGVLATELVITYLF
ncbi:MAG: AzlD domain-containing protein [Clostridia bacterium]|nr:AzlD domain-containing protein [Clostridia bacterium]